MPFNLHLEEIKVLMIGLNKYAVARQTSAANNAVVVK